MELNKGISTIGIVFIVLIIILVAGFMFQKYGKLINSNTDSIKSHHNKITPEDSENDDETSSPEEKPKVAIILDDLGNSFKIDKKIANIDDNINLAILPGRDSTLATANYFNELDRFQLLLHMPLEPIAAKDVEEDMIMTNMSRNEIKLEVDKYFNQLGSYIEGVNNHKGSQYSSNKNKVKILLEEVKKKNLFFVDSFTYKDSVIYETAKELNIETARRDIFLDNSNNKDDIKRRLEETLELAKEEGEAIAIGHARPNTISVLKEEIPNKEVDFVKLSEILE